MNPLDFLELAGELATGSFYAGIPHPPGYPVWTIYTWLWTVILPIKNVAWRVALGEATSGAFAAGPGFGTGRDCLSRTHVDGD